MSGDLLTNNNISNGQWLTAHKILLYQEIELLLYQEIELLSWHNIR